MRRAAIFSFLFQILVNMNEMSRARGVYLPSQKTPLLSHHLHALELQDTKQTNIKNRQISEDKHTFKNSCSVISHVVLGQQHSIVFNIEHVYEVNI